MNLAQKTLWIIERNSDKNWTLETLAQASGVSRSHLANVFATARGQPVMQYLRHRRLSQAAEALVAGASDILALALESGYGSHEAFTRAFKDQFGIAPEQVRSNGTIQGLPVAAPLSLNKAPCGDLEPPRITRAPELHAVGLAEQQSIDTIVRIPDQWRRFMQRYGAIEDAYESIPIGLVTPANMEGLFDYVCAVEVSHFAAAPSGLSKYHLPALDYAVFEHRNHISTIFDTYEAIWNEALPATGRIMADSMVIERHKPAFNPMTGEGGVSIWVPLLSK